MATTLGANGVFYPTYGSTTRPSSPTAGQVIYNSDIQALEVYTADGWHVVSRDTQFLYRTIIAYSYVAGGYKSSAPWRNVNKMVHSTDACSDLGDLLQNAGSYVSGFNNRDNAFVFGCDGTWPGTASYTSSFNMRNDTTKTHSTNHNMTIARNDSATAFKEHEFGIILSGGNATSDVINGTTETMITSSVSAPSTSSGGAQGALGVLCDENHSLVGDAATAFNGVIFHSTLSSMTLTTGLLKDSTNAAQYLTSDGQQKPIHSKLRLGWIKNEGTYQGGYNYRRWNMSTFTHMATFTAIDTNFGEENYDMGQAHQYMMGNYNGAQNNNGHKFYYATESGTMLSTGSVRTGVPGGSSGACSWRD